MDDFAVELADILDKVEDAVKKAALEGLEETAKQARKKLKETSPKLTGDYQKGWRVKRVQNGRITDIVVHNATDYQLTHLLENGHAKKNGGFVKPRKHIKPVEEWAQQEAVRKVMEELNNDL